ncbi:GEL complex subunit OPTI-like isoform X2 [Littorina saxatilis]|uniref:GEL complex subunit OPTI-like isoform X2 n=1 Tax=Littorina saxatilis TaxID=31220 RepID=UPI0038B5B8CF
MANTTKRPASKSNDAEGSKGSLLSKALTAEYGSWNDKDEFLDVIYWLRQILGVILGLIWGLLPMKGILGIAIFFLVNVAIVYIYSSTFQKVDEEEYGGMGEILKEGLMTSFSSFLVCWIILYSSLHVEFSS